MAERLENGIMSQPHNAADAAALFKRIVARRGTAICNGIDDARDGLHAVEFHGLTINFHNSMCLEPGCTACLPMSVTVWSDADKDTVFVGDFDPDDPSAFSVVEWTRGRWESLIPARLV